MSKDTRDSDKSLAWWGAWKAREQEEYYKKLEQLYKEIDLELTDKPKLEKPEDYTNFRKKMNK